MDENNPIPAFKKPVLIGKVGKLPKQVQVQKSEQTVNINKPDETTELTNVSINENTVEKFERPPEPPAQEPSQKGSQLNYTEPEWSGTPSEDSHYGLEILKQGSIIGSHSLQDKSYWIFGRLPQCDLSMAHPTISRYIHIKMLLRDSSFNYNFLITHYFI